MMTMKMKMGKERASPRLKTALSLMPKRSSKVTWTRMMKAKQLRLLNNQSNLLKRLSPSSQVSCPSTPSLKNT